MPYSISNLEKRLDELAAIMSDADDGERYLPIYVRIEKEIDKLKSRMSTMDRIRQRAANANRVLTTAA